MNAPRVVPDLIRHPRNPFERECADATEVYPHAFEYVRRFGEHLGLTGSWLEGLSRPPLETWTVAESSESPPEAALQMRWLHSYVVRREQGEALDQSGVLLAGACLDGGDAVYLSKPRLRVVFHLYERTNKRYVRFCGMSAPQAETHAGAASLPVEHVEPLEPSWTASQAVSAKVFARDPASWAGPDRMAEVSPRQGSERFQDALESRPLGELPASGERVQLRDRYVHVFNSPIVEPAEPEGAAKAVAVTTGNEPRTNDFAAISAFHHCGELFRRMRSYGLEPSEYFRCAELPVEVEYRSTFARAVDGRIRNANVRWARPPEPGRPGRILMRLGSADPDAPAESPLGIACDPRWCWHELGHVLLMAALGEREFRFCHSAGDALAAILNDPRSKLRDDADWRGVTFPWVTLGRRHDRPAGSSWAWGGMLDRNEEGYWQEQILSSTLFRLYRALGGDARDEAARVAAADYSAYLVIQAIGLLGPAAISPAPSVDHFVSALIDADIGTSTFLAENGQRRIGGTAHKVVRWAFEQQGLFSQSTPARGPGEPELVDIYVEGDLEGGYGAGLASYHIAVNAPAVNKASTVSISVANRGAWNTGPVKVTLWIAGPTGGWPHWPGSEARDKPAAWEKLDDRTCELPGRRADGSAARANLEFQWRPRAPGRHVLLAVVSCEDDPANTDEATRLPCALLGAPLLQLVAGDNNLGVIETNVSAT